METHNSAVEDIVRAHAGREGALLPILHDLQANFGWISEDAIQAVADRLNLSRAEVSGVVSFYHDFRRSPDARPVIRLCRAEACQARGGEQLAAEAERLAADRIRIEKVYCLGLCSVGPNAMIGDAIYARLDREQIAALMAGL